MLKLARISRQPMRAESVDLSAIAREIVERLREAEPRREVRFVVADGAVATGDRAMLRIVMENLLGNAWKFTGRHERATIEFGITDEKGSKAYFVRDDGAGFDMAFAGRLFGAFQRLHAGKEFEGNGVGLAVVQRILHRHRGSIHAEAAIEKGATFTFKL